MEKPILPYLHGRKLVYTHPGDPFSIILYALIALGVALAIPVILYQIWAFVMLLFGLPWLLGFAANDSWRAKPWERPERARRPSSGTIGVSGGSGCLSSYNASSAAFASAR